MNQSNISREVSSEDSSRDKGTRMVEMERKMDQMSKELQMLQKEKAEMKTENQKLRQRMDDIQVGQMKQQQQQQQLHAGPQAVLIADSHPMMVMDASKSQASPPPSRTNSNKKAIAAIVCILLLAGAITGGVMAAISANKTAAANLGTATDIPTFSATLVPTNEVTIQDDDDPPPSSDNNILQTNSFVVTRVQREGRSFTVPFNTFPLEIDGSGDNNPSNRTTIRMWNKRTDVIKGVMLELLPPPSASVSAGGPTNVNSRSSSSSSSFNNRRGVVRGYYNPREYTKPNDFQPGDELVAVDYQPFLADGSCTRQEYGIVSVNSGLGWDVDPGNIRIGRLGVVGAWYEDFEYTFHLDKPVQALWTDAVGIDIEYSTADGSGYQSLLPPDEEGTSEDNRSVRPFHDGPVSGTVKIKFKGASFTNMNGLVTHRDAGGLHVAFCADRSGGGGSDDGSTNTPPVSPTLVPTTNDRGVAVANALARYGVSNPDSTAFNWLTNTDTWFAGENMESFQWVERYALAVFFQKANGDNWSKKTDWMTSGVGVCNWQGVSCNAQDAVIGLDLRNAGLSGTIATELGLLTRLFRIRTQNDNIAEDGRIPAAFTQMSNLKTLFMRNCGVNKIGPELLGMSNLNDLLLRGNRFFSTIPSEIYSLTKLTSLNLKECKLQSQIPSQISQLTDLETLDVSVNSLQAPIPEGLTQMPRLRKLVLGQNPWSTTIPTWFGQLTKLQELFLAFSHMQGNIPPEISQMTSLTRLTFNKNQLTGSIPPLPVTLTNCNMQNNWFNNTANKGLCSV